MVSPFLLRAVLDEAIPQNDTQLLAVLVAGMIAIAIATGALGVAQTLLSNTVGQRVMHDLRAAVYRHLQRLSLAFFTQTRTGEVQSRIANDIGGVQTVVTSTATSIVSNVTTVLAATAAMFLLDWRLAVAALGLLPFFVWLTRRVGEERRRITAVRQDRLADMSSLVEESLSVSGILLGKTMGRAPELAERFEGESAALADLEVRSRMAGRWRMASVQMSFAAMPALIYLFAGLTIANGGGAITIGTLVAFTTLQTRLFFPVQSLLSVGVDVQSSLALFERVFHYLDLPVDIEERQGAVALAPDRVTGAVSFEGVGFRYGPDGPWTLRDIDLEVPPGTTLALVGETGSGKTTLAYLLARLYDVDEGRVAIDGVDVRDMTHASLATLVGVVSQETHLFHASIADNLRFAKPGASDAELEAGGARRPDPRPDRPPPRRLRDDRGRTRLPVLRRREATDRDRPHGPARPADPRARRGDERARHRDRASRAGGARRARARAHHGRDRPSAVDRPERGADRRARPGRLVELGDHDELMAAGGRYAAMVAVQGGDLTPA